MADQFFQIFNPLQGFDTPGIGYPQLQYLSLEYHFPPLSNQGYMWAHGEPCLWPPAFEPIWPPPEFPEAGSQTITAPDWSDWNCWSGFGALSSGQICANSWRHGQRITDQRDDKTLPHTGDYPLGQSINPPFVQGNGIQSQSPLLFCDDSHGRSPNVSVQLSELTPYLSPISLCQRHVAPILDSLSFKVPQYASETQSAKRSNRGGTGSKEWPCPQYGCNKTYNRTPYLTRHIRDKHKTRRKCPFCAFTWTRADVVQKHLKTKHQEQFTEEEYRELLDLRGWHGTIRFVARCGMPMLCSNNTIGGVFEPDDRNVV